MLRMNRSPYSRFWAIWDNQDLVAVVVDKKGAPSFYGGSRRTRYRPHPLVSLYQQHPRLPHALASASAQPRT
jgi:hypothetical protein